MSGAKPISRTRPYRRHACGSWCLAAAFALALAAQGARPRVFLNLDDTHFSWSRHQAGIRPGEKEVRDYVRQYAGTHVTDLAICTGGRISSFPSKVMDCWLDKYHQTNENGRAVNYRGTPLEVEHWMWEVQKIDPVALWRDEARRCGIRMWFSIRMNDCHDNYLPTSVLHPRHFHEHPEWRRSRHRGPLGYFDRNLDYGLPEVRAKVLAYLEETLTRYSPDGLELDWMREPYCFTPGQESVAVMTQFMRDLRQRVAAEERRCGHAIPVAVRMPALPSDALEFGFDPATWADEGLAQVIVPSPRWATTDSDLPLAMWRQLLRNTPALIAPCIELLVQATNASRQIRTDESDVLGAAAQFYSEGMEAIYLYNYFDDPDPSRTYWKPADGQTRMAVRPDGMRRLLHLLGDKEGVMAAERRVICTWHDLRPEWRTAASRLPLAVKPGRGNFLRIATGRVAAGRRVLVRLGYASPDGAEPAIFVNGRAAKFLRVEQCVPAFTDLPLHVFEANGYSESAAVVELVTKKPIEIGYADVTILP